MYFPFFQNSKSWVELEKQGKSCYDKKGHFCQKNLMKERLGRYRILVFTKKVL